jgi:hypothetical protein
VSAAGAAARLILAVVVIVVVTSISAEIVGEEPARHCDA